VCPTSELVRVYVCDVAPEIVLQDAPPELQRCHLYANEIGVVPLQVPLDAVSVWPLFVWPDTVGGDVLLGAVSARAGAATASPATTADRSAADHLRRESLTILTSDFETPGTNPLQPRLGPCREGSVSTRIPVRKAVGKASVKGLR
jgi:hypothetical protein